MAISPFSVVFVSVSQLLAVAANLFDNHITRCNNAHFAYNAWIIFRLFLRVWTKLPRPPSQGSCIFPKWKSIKLPGYGPNMIFIAWLVCMRWVNERLPILQRHARLLKESENSHNLYHGQASRLKRFEQMLNNIKDWWISFGSHVYRIGLKKWKSVGIWDFLLEKNSLPGKEDYLSDDPFVQEIFSLNRFLFLHVPPLFFLFLL